MTQYVEMALKARRNVSVITLWQQKQIAEIYDRAIKNLAAQAAKTKADTLTKRWQQDYIKALDKEKTRIRAELEGSVVESMEKAADQGIIADIDLFKRLQKEAGVDLGDHFTDMFSQVPTEVLHTILSGELYEDGRSLSQRIWNYADDLGNELDYMIKQAIAEKKSAIGLAADIEHYVKDPARRSSNWGKAYPGLRNKIVDTSAMRLARTAINHSYQTATIQSANKNPFVEGIEWRSALQHGRTCDLCKERHGHIFQKDDVPLDHPNGLCSMIPHIPKSLDEIADELVAWKNGENPKLDRKLKGITAAKPKSKSKPKTKPKPKPDHYVDIKDLTQEVNEGLAKYLGEAIEHGIKNGTECLLTISSKTGKLASPKLNGTSGSVTFSSDLISLLNNAENDSLILIHNHPGSSSFSCEDINVLVSRKSIKYLAVIGHDETKYMMSIGNGKRPMFGELVLAWKRANGTHYDYYNKKVMNGEMTSHDAWREQSDLMVRDMAVNYGWDYRRVLPNDK
jgi:hypothetical protein